MKITFFLCLFLLSHALAQISTPQPTPVPTNSSQPTPAPTSTSQPEPQPEPEPVNIDCSSLGFTCPDLRQALITANQQSNGGIGFPLWISAVNRIGQVCCVEFSGVNVTSQWLTARLSSAVKAFTANGVSIDQLALSTANLYTLNQPGNFWNGNEGMNPPRAEIAWSGNAGDFGTSNDPMIGQVVGGYSINGGGLALYQCSGNTARVVGGIGIAGDTSCADHVAAWRVRNLLGLDFVPSGVHSGNSTSTSDDNIIYASEQTSTGFAHPQCSGGDADVAVKSSLPAVRACGAPNNGGPQ